MHNRQGNTTLPTMMSSTTMVKSAGGPVGIQQQPQSSSLRLIRLEVINQHKGIEGVGVGEQLKVVHLRISDTGVEIIEEGHQPWVAEVVRSAAVNIIETVDQVGVRIRAPVRTLQQALQLTNGREERDFCWSKRFVNAA